MTDTQKLDQMMTKLRNNIEENTVTCDAPQSKRTYTYRKSPAIKACDVRL